ncbi:hypothetical protein HPB48_004263 [Haemaphysalis longicornis]|uniref:Uncharacterized protein n=1 Tax=Haemaphysalis longicornis TaxID=44386 RepID=A0A9J6GM90_HAELO|nr:hypothetical protein HPB48_004263 [Haemaphysalis longicornis]
MLASSVPSRAKRMRLRHTSQDGRPAQHRQWGRRRSRRHGRHRDHRGLRGQQPTRDDDGSDEAADDDATGQDKRPSRGCPFRLLPGPRRLGVRVRGCPVTASWWVTGGQDDRWLRWRPGHGRAGLSSAAATGDSVTGAAFNHDSTLVATADMAGAVRVWGVGDRQKVVGL